jgi:methylmalonyl-CoA/ethylmalonyl-CoA epimerase
MFKRLDHVAIVVADTGAALRLWRDQLSLPVLFTEVVNAGTTQLTHLDLGNAHLQLVQPLTPDHPLHAWLAEHGPGLHHFCLTVADLAAVGESLAERGLVLAGTEPHQGTQRRRALFMDVAATGGVMVELTG